MAAYVPRRQLVLKRNPGGDEAVTVRRGWTLLVYYIFVSTARHGDGRRPATAARIDPFPLPSTDEGRPCGPCAVRVGARAVCRVSTGRWYYTQGNK
jgi:hypothetical protein